MKLLKKFVIFILLFVLWIFLIVGVFDMPIKDLSPKFKLKKSELELELPDNSLPMGQSAGGLQLYSNKFKRGYGDNVFGSDENGIWLGGAEFAAAPFRVGMDGSLVATSAAITGVGVNFVSTIVWTATDEDTATWASGVIKTSEDITYSISGGNTGDITTTTYIYLDPSVSTTVLQTSTTATDAAGSGKVLIATVQKGATGAKCIIDVVGASGTTIDGNRITTGKIQSSDGNTYFDLDNDRIQIQDDTNTTIIDGSGILSSATFGYDYYFANNEITTTSDSYVDVSGSSLTFTLPNNNTRILLLFTYIGLNSASSTSNLTYGVSAYINVDGNDYNPVAITRSLADSSYNVASSNTVTTQRILNFGSGSHTIKIRWKRVGGGGTAKMYDRALSYIILGK